MCVPVQVCLCLFRGCYSLTPHQPWQTHITHLTNNLWGPVTLPVPSSQIPFLRTVTRLHLPCKYSRCVGALSTVVILGSYLPPSPPQAWLTQCQWAVQIHKTRSKIEKSYNEQQKKQFILQFTRTFLEKCDTWVDICEICPFCLSVFGALLKEIAVSVQYWV